MGLRPSESDAEETKELMRWSVWIDGEFGEFTFVKIGIVQEYLMKDLFMLD